MAHKKGQGSTRNGRDSNPQFRGVKVYGDAVIAPRWGPASIRSRWRTGDAATAQCATSAL